MEDLIPIFMLIIGLAIGGGGIWLLMRSKLQHISDIARSDAEKEIATLTERLEQERAAADKQLADKEQLSNAFKAMSADALKNNNESFLELAKSTLEKYQESAKGDLDKRQTAIGELLKPVRESLTKVESKLGDVEKERATAYRGLTEQIKSLSQTERELQSQTADLVKALRKPKTRGRWGEMQLRRVVEMAGMIEHCDFYEQPTVTGEQGMLRPDMVVRLPGDKMILIDAKTPLEAFLDAIETEDDEQKRAKLNDHARHVRQHVSAVSRKSYHEQFDHAPEFVVLFLPGEGFFSAALDHDPTLIEFGVDKDVIIATPTTLIALLRAVAYGWRQEKLAQNAKEISDLGKELYKRLSTMGGHLSRVGKQLHAATASFNETVASLESRVLVTARKFDGLAVSSTNTPPIDELQQIDQIPRELQAPELQSTDHNKAEKQIAKLMAPPPLEDAKPESKHKRISVPEKDDDGPESPLFGT